MIGMRLIFWKGGQCDKNVLKNDKLLFFTNVKFQSETQISIQNRIESSFRNGHFDQKPKFWCLFFSNLYISHIKISISERNFDFWTKFRFLNKISISELNFDFWTKLWFLNEISSWFLNEISIWFPIKFGFRIEIWVSDRNLGFKSKFGVRIEISTWHINSRALIEQGTQLQTY